MSERVLEGSEKVGEFYWKVFSPTILSSFPPCQKLKSFDDTGARGKPGVEDVISFDDKVAVLGKSTWEVLEAKKALVIEWETDTPLESTEEHDQQMLALLDEAPAEHRRKDGNIGWVDPGPAGSADAN